MGLFGNGAASTITRLAPDEALRLLQGEGYVGELLLDVPEQPRIRFKVEGFKCFLYFYTITEGKARSLQFHAAFNDKLPLEQVNEWNKTKRYLKVYLDNAGDVAIDMDVDLDGGVTEAHVIEAFKTWRSIFLMFLRFAAG